MVINCKSLSKRFNRHSVIKDFTYSFKAGNKYAITGRNGSGKSTLLRLISGQLEASAGEVLFAANDKTIEVADRYKYLSFSAPYIDLPESFTMQELLDFHANFKEMKPREVMADYLKQFKLEQQGDKKIAAFSSGMKQRLKLILTLGTLDQVKLLDEPTSNFDSEGIEVYRQLLLKEDSQSLFIIASNETREIDFCNQKIEL